MPELLTSPSPPKIEQNDIRKRSVSRTEGTRSRKDRQGTPNTPKTPLDTDGNDQNKEDKKEVQLMPIQRRPKPSESFEKPVSGRELWWRSTIRETPNPGTYEHDNFVDNLGKKKNTYRFRSDGRKRDPHPQIGKGAYLMPGAYEYEDLEKRVMKSAMTYSFKNTSRESRNMMLFGKKDKDVNIPPNAYEIGTYLSIHADKTPSKNWTFKSTSTRFPTTQFIPKEGPGPGGYEYRPIEPAHVVSSSFNSKTPRFSTSHTRRYRRLMLCKLKLDVTLQKVPGPGTYARTEQTPIQTTIAQMGRVHGLFFSSAFRA